MRKQKEKKPQSAAVKMIKDTVTLVVITVVAAVLLGFVYDITRAPIAKREAEAKAEAYRSVYPEAVGIKEMADDETLAAMVNNAAATLSAGGFSGVIINEACIVLDGNSDVIGYIVTVTDRNGFNGNIKMTFGYTKDGVVTALEFLSITETSGLGLEADTPKFKEKFAGKKVDAFTVTKTGSTADSEIDALSGATITSNAVVEGVNAGIYFVKQLIENNVGGGAK